jgi:hypothetical protein
VLRTHPNAGVVLLSDDTRVVDVLHNFPDGAVSSPLLIPGAPEPIHIDTPAIVGRGRAPLTPAQVVTAMRSVFAEFVMLSAVDALVHSKSGFSTAPAVWGGVPHSNLRLLPKADGVRTQWRTCEPDAFDAAYYQQW